MHQNILYQVKNVSFSYSSGINALQHINMHIYQGEFLVLLGVNGSGKTTLLNHLCRLLRPQAGEIRLFHKNITDYAEKELYQKVNMVFQDPSDQLFSTTVEEDITFGPQNLGLAETERERRLTMVLEMVGLKEFRQRYIHELSFGEKKRVALAGALAMGSQVLLLDEPTSGIDPVGASEIFQLLHRLSCEQGITIIMATQNVDMIPVYASRIALLSRGKIEVAAPVKDFFNNVEVLRRHRIRLPRVAHLMEILHRKDGLGKEPYPLTIGQARQGLLEAISDKDGRYTDKGEH